MQNKKSAKPFQKGKNFKKYQNKSQSAAKPKDDEEIERIQAQIDSIDPSKVKHFSDFPLSWKTQKGIRESNYKVPTEIQRQSIGYALQGRDILGAAQTGSGKTLAFLIPVIENLFMKKWTRLDGIGAIIISPTRELAYQIFETLKKIGAHHDFSAGLIIGGKNLKFEKKRMDQCNIIICTPGRLLQHMDENPLFDASTMQVLVLDEADRCLDMGFEQTMNGIIENLPPERQTLLFSATQTKSVKDLARLSLDNAVYVAPTEQQTVTPDNLKQSYVVVNLEDKITMLWSFIKSHLKQKCIVFLSSCKQVKYIYEMFCKLRPGTSLLALYGTLHQDRRVAIYQEFCRKSNVVLFATDIASRGLDFPTVNWVIQLDCPEDVTQYIHRAGRTARHKARGESLLVLLPSEEEGMVAELKDSKINIDQIHIDPRKLFSPKGKMEGFLAQNKELKETAQRAFVSYIKSVFLMKNKKIFNVSKLNTDDYAKSLGLVVVPRVRFLERFKKRQAAAQKTNKDDGSSEESSSDEDEDDHEGTSKVSKKDDDVNFNLPHSDDSDNSEAEEELFKIKRRDHEIEVDGDSKIDDAAAKAELTAARKAKVLTKAAQAKRVLKKRIQANTKVEFNEDGTEVLDTRKQLQSDLARDYINQDEGGIDIETAKKVLREEDKFDKQRFKEIVKAKHKVQKKKSKSKKTDDVDEDDEADDFGSDADADDQQSIDLSWLPDPKKVYNVVNSDSDSSDDNEDQNADVSESESLVHRPPKRLYEKKKKSRNSTESDNIASASDDNDDDGEEEQPRKKKAKQIADKLSLNEAEIIAMQLLGK
ncbi:probable ATP-dependent RNA helicase DDX10 [Eupeodes corollae]|uniref:probable ATP-dependent RNA helicase DDX10 n=1 Tax=Eupeodes corollae TaxID=290404 RepID=UPI00248F9FEA|nr:probable ATP-dependent RNA helicase DDX10 [Eupeodes corollae]